jgi:DNA-binding Lrp family transcriptional regulator
MPVRYRIAQWMEFRATEPDISNVEIARRMGISRRTLQAALTKATREGWLVFTDPVSRIEHEIVPRVLDNMVLFLDQKDKTATIEAYKSTVARQYLEAKGVSEAPQTVLALKIETMDPGQVKVVTGHVVGKAKELKVLNDET